MFCFNAGYKGGAGAKIRRKCGAGAKATTEDDYAKGLFTCKDKWTRISYILRALPQRHQSYTA